MIDGHKSCGCFGHSKIEITEELKSIKSYFWNAYHKRIC